MKKPPKKLSDLIELAIADLEKVREDDRYTIDMGHWHTVNISTCKVCLAGCVMAKSLNADIKDDHSDISFGDNWDGAFLALDHIRQYEVAYAIITLDNYCKDKFTPKNIEVAVLQGITKYEYEDDPLEFVYAMKMIASRLRESFNL